MMEFDYSKCPECGYVNKNQPDVCPSCGCDLKAYRDELQDIETSANKMIEAQNAFADEQIETAMQGYENEDCALPLLVALLGGSSEKKEETGVNRYGFMLLALYRYYNSESDDEIRWCYNRSLELLARYVSSSKDNKLKSVIGYLTPSAGIKAFFELILAELELEGEDVSPFEDLWVENILDIFVRRFKKDADFSENSALNNMVEGYISQLSDEYDVSCDLDGNEEDNSEDDYYEDMETLCPYCESDIKITRCKDGDRIKCAVCKRTFALNEKSECPECGTIVCYDSAFDTNPIKCSFCGCRFEANLNDQYNDENAISSTALDLSDYKPMYCGDGDPVLKKIANTSIEFAMKGYENEDRSIYLLVTLLRDPKGRRFGSDIDRCDYLLNALYQYYSSKSDDRIENCYNKSLNLMACYLSSSRDINDMRSVIEYLTPSIGVTSFFGLITVELELEKNGASPFKKLELKEFVDIFVKGFKKDAELSANDELFNTVKKYVDRICKQYNLDCAAV